MEAITDELFERILETNQKEDLYAFANSIECLLNESRHIDIKDFDEPEDMQRVYAHYKRTGRILDERGRSYEQENL